MNYLPALEQGDYSLPNLRRARPPSFKRKKAVIQMNCDLYQKVISAFENYTKTLDAPFPAFCVVQQVFAECNPFKLQGYANFSREISKLGNAAQFLLNALLVDEPPFEAIFANKEIVEIAAKVSYRMNRMDWFNRFANILFYLENAVGLVLSGSYCNSNNGICRSLGHQDLRIARLISLGLLFDFLKE